MMMSTLGRAGKDRRSCSRSTNQLYSYDVSDDVSYMQEAPIPLSFAKPAFHKSEKERGQFKQP